MSTYQELLEIYREYQQYMSFREFERIYYAHQNQQIQGYITLIDHIPTNMSAHLNSQELIDWVGKQSLPIKQSKNQILLSGLMIYLQRGFGAMSNIQCGNSEQNNAQILQPSTFTTNSSIQNPLTGLVFRREGIPQVSTISNGYRYSFRFVRPAISYGGNRIDELGVLVNSYEGNGQLLCRLVARNNNQSSIPGTTNALPHIFSSSHDTICIYDLEYRL